jgi:hypothetical protein
MLTVLERGGWRGDITVTVHGPSGVHVARFPNLITDAGLNLLREALAGADGEIKYVAVGDVATAPTNADVALGGEQFRKAVATQVDGGVGVLDTTVVLGPADALGFTIREIGWFAGAAATGVAGTGVLVARVLYERAKTNLESVEIDRRDTIGRA